MDMCTCSNCKAWHYEEGKPLGQCWLKPPQATLVMGRDLSGQTVGQVFSFYPETAAEHQCGEGEMKAIGQGAISLS